MVPILTGLGVALIHVMAVPRHLDVLAPIGAEVPTRGGTTGGYWGLVHGLAVVALGGALIVARSLWGDSEWREASGVFIGLLILSAGLIHLYWASRTAVHDHPHVHPHTSHEHIHTHLDGAQTHDHALPEASLAHGALGPANLVAAIPAGALSTADAVIYLVVYLVAGVIVMSSFGYWLGASRRRGDTPLWVMTSMRWAGYGTLALGGLWIADYLPR